MTSGEIRNDAIVHTRVERDRRAARALFTTVARGTFSTFAKIAAACRLACVAFGLAFIGTVGCSRPIEIAVAAHEAFASSNQGAVLRLVHSAYADPLGGRERVLHDLTTFEQRFARMDLRITEASASKSASENRVLVVGRLDAELLGRETWRITGPITLELEREDGLRVVSGLLSDVRDVVALMENRRSALEANDATALGGLLHPNYRDGDLDRDGAIERARRDLDGISVRLQPTHYRLELRGPTAHLDEHYTIRVNDRVLPPSIGRFTLIRSAGRWRIHAGLYPAAPPRPGSP